MINSKPLFTFAAITDSHLNPEGTQNTSPWRTNRLANARNEFLVAELNRIKPAFVVHIGDILHPLPSSPLFSPTAEFAKRMFGKLQCPFHLLPGNHDVGDKPLDWMPADRVTANSVLKYRATFGHDWSAFTHRGCRFILINTSLLNSGLPFEAEQRAWLEAELASASGQRIFMFAHYPPFIARADEESHYDNLDEPARGWLLQLLVRHKVEALFSGHVHNFFYNRHRTTRCYVLPSITFLRHDYSELFRIEPAEEYGRNDAEKLGFFLVDVHERGHVARFIRTNGNMGEPSGVKSVSTRAAIASPIGVHLRHPWSEEAELPYNGPLDELSRKKVRNDYGLLAMWDLGIKRVRVPISDLVTTDIRARIADIRDLGCEVTVFSFGLPQPTVLAAMRGHRDLVDRWELILPKRVLSSAIEVLGVSAADLPRIFVSKLHEHDGAEQDASKPFDHSISIGFAPTDENGMLDWLASAHARTLFSGVVFTVTSGDAVVESAAAVAEICARADTRAMVAVKLGPLGSAGAPTSDAFVASRVAEVILCSQTFPQVEFFLDTFQEIDRGYFLRPGLVDRRCNPSVAGRIFRDLQHEISDLQFQGNLRRVELDGRRGIIFAAKGGDRTLWLPNDAAPFVEARAQSKVLSG